MNVAKETLGVKVGVGAKSKGEADPALLLLYQTAVFPDRADEQQVNYEGIV